MKVVKSLKPPPPQCKLKLVDIGGEIHIALYHENLCVSQRCIQLFKFGGLIEKFGSPLQSLN